jgi:hypothetical protein
VRFHTVAMVYYIYPPYILSNPPTSTYQQTHTISKDANDTTPTPTTTHMQQSSQVTSSSSEQSVSLSTERHNRMYACHIIVTTCHILELPQSTICTAQNILHRFYCRQSMQHYKLLYIILTSIYLAQKVEEFHTRSINQIIIALDRCLKIIQLHIHHTNNSIPSTDTSTIAVIDRHSVRYMKWRNIINTYELVILRTLGYTLYVDHPHKFLLHFINALTPYMNINDMENEKYRLLAQHAWNYANDSMYTIACIQYKPYDIAVTCISLAADDLAIDLPMLPQPWYIFFDSNLQIIQSISKHIKALYSVYHQNTETRSMLRYIPLNDEDAKTNPLMFHKPPMTQQHHTSAASRSSLKASTSSNSIDLLSPSSSSSRGSTPGQGQGVEIIGQCMKHYK